MLLSYCHIHMSYKWSMDVMCLKYVRYSQGYKAFSEHIQHISIFYKNGL